MPSDDLPPPDLCAAALAALPALAAEEWVPLRGGRSNRLWRVGDQVIKFYQADAESPLFPNDIRAEAAALRHLAPKGLAPALRHEGDGWLAYAHQPGLAWTGGDPGRVSRVLAAVHGLSAGPFRRLASGSSALLDQGLRIAAECRGNLPAPPADCGVAPCAPRLIHGDAVAGNILCDGSRTMLIDWQCPALGDPAEDLAAFLSPAMQWVYRGHPLTDAEEWAFLLAYPDPSVVERFLALRPLFRWRMAAHCLWKAERGAADYAAAMALELGAA